MVVRISAVDGADNECEPLLEMVEPHVLRMASTFLGSIVEEEITW